jgi:hypothetical protein
MNKRKNNKKNIVAISGNSLLGFSKTDEPIPSLAKPLVQRNSRQP